MKGPTPKPINLRQRKNRVATAAKLSLGQNGHRRAPSLPSGRSWHPLTRRWWHDTWHSPMAAEFLQADIHGLYRLAFLIDEFWLKPTAVKLATEIRQEQTAYGLTPIDRRRLQWEVERVEKGKRQPRPAAADGDARNYLRAVK